MRHHEQILTAAAIAIILAASHAAGSMISMTGGGWFVGSSSTANGTQLGADTPFTFIATFNNTTDTYPMPDTGLYPSQVVFDIVTYGTCTAAPAADMEVVMDDIGAPSPVAWRVSLVGGGGARFQTFGTASPPIDVDEPGASVLSHSATAAPLPGLSAMPPIGRQATALSGPTTSAASCRQPVPAHRQLPAA